MSVTLEQFAEIIGVDIELRRYAGQNGRWSAQLERTEVKDGGCLVGAYGDGASPQSAMANYATRLAGQRIVVNAYSDNRREFNVPEDLA